VNNQDVDDDDAAIVLIVFVVVVACALLLEPDHSVHLSSGRITSVVAASSLCGNDFSGIGCYFVVTCSTQHAR